MTHVKNGSMFNTPPVVPIYCAMKNLEWVKKNGGVEAMAQRAKERADMLYTEIERNKLFRGTAKAEDRSYMNICFVMNDEYKELEADFLQVCYRTRHGGYKRPPQRRRFPCFMLQRTNDRGCAGIDTKHEGL